MQLIDDSDIQVAEAYGENPRRATELEENFKIDIPIIVENTDPVEGAFCREERDTKGISEETMDVRVLALRPTVSDSSLLANKVCPSLDETAESDDHIVIRNEEAKHLTDELNICMPIPFPKTLSDTEPVLAQLLFIDELINK